MCQESQLAKLGLFDAKVPRYTSYPTVPHFGAQIGPAHLQSWLSQIPAGSLISVYVHIPFCRNLCWFCMCRTQGTRSDTPISTYLEALLQEIALLKSHLLQDVSLSHIHWGGGTPTIFSPDMIRKLTAALATLTPSGDATEFSVEIDPNEFDQARCDALCEAGLTRASIGVQGFDRDTQQAIGRDLQFSTVQNVVAMLQRGGVQNLTTDLLFGLPHQTLPRIKEAAENLLSLLPDRVALYGYKHLPAMIRRQTMISSEALPKPEDRLKLFMAARDVCRQAGYQQIGIDSFARSDDALVHARDTRALKRGFQGYSDDPAEFLIGLGASAISRFPQGYVQNAPSTARYVAALQSGCFAAARGHGLQGQDHLRGRMIEALLCSFSIPRDHIIDQCPGLEAQFDHLITDAATAFPDMLIPTSNGASLAASARPMARVIARHFDAYESIARNSGTGVS